jgi:hypothetical protein
MILGYCVYSKNLQNFVEFEVPRLVVMKNSAFWNGMPYSLLKGLRDIEGHTACIILIAAFFMLVSLLA